MLISVKCCVGRSARCRAILTIHWDSSLSSIRDQMHVVGKVRFFHAPKVTDVLLVLLYRKAGGKESPSPWVQPMGTEEEGKP